MDSPQIPGIDETPETTTSLSPDMRLTIPEYLQAADHDLCEFFSFPVFFLIILAY